MSESEKSNLDHVPSRRAFVKTSTAAAVGLFSAWGAKPAEPAAAQEPLGGASWLGLCALVGALTLAFAEVAAAADPDLDRAEHLVCEGKYEEAYDLLAPFEDALKDDPTFNYLLGRAALGTGRADKAKALFEQSLALRPDSVAEVRPERLPRTRRGSLLIATTGCAWPQRARIGAGLTRPLRRVFR